MIHALLITLVVLTLAHDGLQHAPFIAGAPSWLVVAGTLAPMALCALLSHLGCWQAGRAIDRHGRWQSVRLADWSLNMGRIGVTMAYGVAVLGLGWLDFVRTWTGNLPLVDEALAVAPPLSIFVLGWWSYFPVERRLREAMILRKLDDPDASIVRPPTRGEYILEQLRHQVLFVLAPVAMIACWTEGLDLLTASVAEDWPWVEGPWGGPTILALHFLGVLGVLAVMPLVLRVLWDTAPLGAGMMRDRLLGLSATEGVRCRDLLVWRTRSGMLNGAVVGLVPWLRYILLTDGLLERLAPEQVEAVMAHEVAHARQRHLPWLMVALLAGVGAGWLVMWKLLGFVLDPARLAVEGPAQSLAAVCSLLSGIVTGFLAFGFVSRRFEQQADAFAAQRLSGWTRPNMARRDILISAASVMAMAGALGRVAAFNHIPVDRFTWRHGSIRSRQRRLVRLTGRPAHRLPVDGLVTIIKVASFLALGAVVIGILTDTSLGPF